MLPVCSWAISIPDSHSFFKYERDLTYGRTASCMPCRESGSEPGTIACISITALLGSVLALLRREKNKDIMGEKDRLSLGAATSESLTDMVFTVSREMPSEIGRKLGGGSWQGDTWWFGRGIFGELSVGINGILRDVKLAVLLLSGRTGEPPETEAIGHRYPLARSLCHLLR